MGVVPIFRCNPTDKVEAFTIFTVIAMLSTVNLEPSLRRVKIKFKTGYKPTFNECQYVTYTWHIKDLRVGGGDSRRISSTGETTKGTQ